jgi:pimeloyl-ACP methyl ester carboxylesterase
LITLKRKLLVVIASVVAVASWWLSPATTNLVRYALWRANSNGTSQYVQVNGESLYVETHGDGLPVLLLPGGLSTLDSFFSQWPSLAARYRVIAIEPRGHGRSTPITELTYRQLAADAIAVLDALGIAQVSIVGWSDGGTTGLMMALEYPQRVKKLVAISANFSPTGIDAAAQSAVSDDATAGPNRMAYVLYRWRAGRNANWDELRRVVTTMWLTRPIMAMSELQRVRAPTLLIVGSNDLVTLEHTREMAAMLGDAELCVIEEGHHTSLIWDADEVTQRIMDFLARADT